jgi:hypothetical protein
MRMQRSPALILLPLLAVLGVLGAAAHAQPPAAAPVPTMRGDGPAPEAKPFSVTRTDPALDALVPRNARAELIATGFGLNEGPVWVPEGQSGYLVIGGLLDNVLYKITPDKQVSVFLDRAGYTGADVSYTGTQTRARYSRPARRTASASAVRTTSPSRATTPSTSRTTTSACATLAATRTSRCRTASGASRTASRASCSTQ